MIAGPRTDYLRPCNGAAYLDENIGSRALIAELANAHHTATYCRDLGYAR